MAFDQMKMLNKLRKAQSDLKKEIIEVEAGDGAVVVQITGELKIKKLTIDPERVDLDDIAQGHRIDLDQLVAQGIGTPEVAGLQGFPDLGDDRAEQAAFFLG